MATAARAPKTHKVQKIKFPLPLANPDTLFTRSSWVSAIECVTKYLAERKLKALKLEDPIRFSIETFDFLKLYDKEHDFEAIQKSLSGFSEVKSSIHENNDRSDEPQLHFAIMGKLFVMGMYKEAMKFCLSYGDGGSDEFPIGKFLGFLEVIEKILTGPGDPMRCKISMTAKLPHATVRISCSYEDPLLFFCGQDFGLRMRSRFVTPDFSIIFDR